MSHRLSWSRRRFLKTAAAAPLFIPGPALGLCGAVAPSERITYGFVGCGSHARDWNLKQVFRCKDAQVVALCDVDSQHLAKAREQVEKHYGEALGASFKGVHTTGDFRELVQRPDVDVVYNGTPDHWHVLPSILAMKAGKDVICEKPLTLFVEEGRALVAAAKQTGRVTQTASENRSIDTYIQLVELVRNGRMGRLQHIRVSLPSGRGTRDVKKHRLEPEPVPPHLDYEMWLGQAPAAPYCPGRVHWNYRWNRDTSGGMLADWGAHLIDVAQWGNDTERGGVVEIEGKGEFPPQTDVWNTAVSFALHARYANGVTLEIVSEGPGVRFEGSEGWIECGTWRAPLRASRPELLAPLGPDARPVFRPSEVVLAGDGGKGGEHRNFIDSVKARTPAYAPFEVGHRTITIAHIGTIAMLLGRKLAWDPAAERFTGDDEANRMLGRPQREPWSLARVDSWLKK